MGGYTYDGRTGDNSAAAGKIAVSLFRELTDNLYVFGQLTTSLSDEGDAEPATETEIDNLLVSFTPPGASNLSLTFGTLDAPVGFERDDEVLLFTPSTSFNFELARPAKLTGLFGGWSLSPRVDLTAMVANGWDSPLDPNHGKTGGLRLGVLPAEGASLGVSALYGSEGPADSTSNRLLLDVDYAFEPGRGWIVAGEANYAKDYDLPGGGDASWSGATLLVHRQVARQLGNRGARGGAGRQGRRPHRPGADAHLVDPRADLFAGRGARGDLRQRPAHDLPDPAIPAPGRSPGESLEPAVLRDVHRREQLGRPVCRAARHHLLAGVAPWVSTACVTRTGR